MADHRLATHLDEERARAARVLLATPLLDAGAEPDDFRLVVRHQTWLVTWFESTCGWGLTVDAAGGFARLMKRSAHPDPTRPLRRARGSEAPFDRRRYQLLCLACAELVRHPVTTVGLLAGAVVAAADLDTTRKTERVAFVDALRTLMAWGALVATAGDVDAFADNEAGNAILTADTARLHRLLSSATTPSSIADGTNPEAATEALLAEPRYGDAGAADEDQRLRWVRHRLARRLIDDPVTYQEDLTGAERDYLGNPAGRRWLRDRVAEAGFELEERAEGLLALDPSARCTDVVFPAPHGNAHQLALLLVDRLLVIDGAGERRPGRLTATELRRAVDDLLEQFPGWARSVREGDGVERFTDEAAGLLVSFGLARWGTAGDLEARPALARYRAGAPTVSGSLTFFEEHT